MVCTSLGSLLRPLFYFLCYIHFSLSVVLRHEIPFQATDAMVVNITQNRMPHFHGKHILHNICVRIGYSVFTIYWCYT